MHTIRAHQSEVYAAAWHPIYEEVLATGGYDGELKFWRVGRASEARELGSVPAAHENAVRPPPRPSGQNSCSRSGEIQISNKRNGKTTTVRENMTTAVNNVARKLGAEP